LPLYGGASLAVFRIRRLKEPKRLLVLLDLSRFSVVISYSFIILVLVSGITLGFLGGFWGSLWIWSAMNRAKFLDVRFVTA
jgi:hypothetical protein